MVLPDQYCPNSDSTAADAQCEEEDPSDAGRPERTGGFVHCGPGCVDIVDEDNRRRNESFGVNPENTPEIFSAF